VSVLVRSPSSVRTYFLEALRYTIGSILLFPLSRYLVLCQRICLLAYLIPPRTLPIVRVLNLLRQSFTIVYGGAGIFNLLPIAYACQPRLRVRLTQGRRTLPWKPWIFGEKDFHLLCRLLMPCIFTSIRSSTPLGIPSLHILRSPTACILRCKPVISALYFSPGYYRRRVSRLVSCYALFK
jgi:hypothetical protein